MRQDILGFRFDDAETLSGIRELYEKFGYVCDPHTAIAYLGLKKSRATVPGILVATAHPAKFPDIVRRACGVEVEIPQQLRVCMGKKKQSIRINNDVSELKELLLSG